MPHFSTLPLSKPLLEAVNELGFSQMTPIQSESLPFTLKGRDLIGQAKTGSGKTAAFALPILDQIQKSIPDLQREPVLKALILCPTRELCAQVEREIRKIARKMIGLRVISLAGGVPTGPQTAGLEKGVHVAVGTPGRVLDHLNKGNLDLRSLQTLVLDEADRMLDMGFEDEMKQILDLIPEVRQTLFFSATFPESIESMSRRYQNDAVRVTVKDEDTELQQIAQEYYVVPNSDSPDELFDGKLQALLGALGESTPDSCIVFVNFKVNAVDLEKELRRRGISAGALHGDLEQPVRDSIMAKFRNSSLRILIATDVAARGIDVEKLDLVINFDLPQKPEIYVHRVGRTGRAGETGKAISLITQKELSRIQAIEQRSHFNVVERTEPWEQKTAFNLESKMETLFLAAGRKNKLRAGDILGALTGDAGQLEGKDIGKIEIHDYFSYVAVNRKVASYALRKLQDGRIKGRKIRAEIAK
jgi:ATP-independent RNA helicase DbpA